MLDLIEVAVEQIRVRRPIIVIDDERRENEGDLTLTACHATPELIGMMVRYGSGVICVSMPGLSLDRLWLPPMTAVNEDLKDTANTVSLDARHGITTRISAADRSRTIRILADERSGPADMNRPGHVFPLRGVPGGVLRRAGHKDASLDFVPLAGLPNAGVICELVNNDGSLMRMGQLIPFARVHGLALVSIADLIHYRWRVERLVRRVADTALPTRYGEFRLWEFRAIAYYSIVDGKNMDGVALVRGDLSDGEDVLVRVHSECLTGDVLTSERCGCGEQFAAAMQQIAALGRGVLLYMRGHEGRGIGLVHKLRGYQLQDSGHDTVAADLALGFPADARDYGTTGQILVDLGVRSIRLLTNNPAKRAALEELGIHVSGCEPLQVPARPMNISYLRTKRDRLGHLLTGLDAKAAPIAVAATPLDRATP